MASSDRKKKVRNTNLRVRGYAAWHGVTLREIASYMDLDQSRFSAIYMARELTKEDQDFLCGIVDKIAGVENEKIQGV